MKRYLPPYLLRRCHSRQLLAVPFLAVAAFAGGAGSTPATQGKAAALPAQVSFNRDVQPILAENCFSCHGPDSHQRKAGLRLDKKEGLFGKLENGVPVVPHNTKDSEIIQRIISADPDEVMPPPKANRKLTAEQVELLKRWVEQGANWEGHWAFTAPKRPDVPAADAAKTRNAIDAFTLDRLQKQGLSPSPEADKVTLIRRLTLDLTGLPPTPAEVDAFLADGSADAYEKVVDRLLASPRNGERLAVDWLDAARYADTNGYHIDTARDMTRWRQWVIDAFNHNKPFDQFTVEQLAGDLLPNATLEQKIASGFNRNNMINFEGGAIPEEYAAAYVIDRVNTTGTVWLGLTVGCTQCHDHKFDPITQKEYYQLFAFFNNVPENGLDGIDGNAVPLLRTPTTEQQQKLDALAAQTAAVEKKLTGPIPEIDAAQVAWEAANPISHKVEWAALTASEMKSTGGAALVAQADGAVLVTGPNGDKDRYTVTLPTTLKRVTALRLEALPDASLSASGPGRSPNGNAVLSEFRVELDAGGTKLQNLPLRSATADFSQNNFPIAAAIDGKLDTGWALYPEVGKPHEAVFELNEPAQFGAANASGRLVVTMEFASVFGQHQLGRFRLSATDAATPAGTGKLPPAVAAALATAAAQRTDAQSAEVRNYYRKTVSPVAGRLTDELASLAKQREAVEKVIPNTMVMAERPQPRATHILLRGQYDKPGEAVTPGVPSFLPQLPKSAKAGRLELAHWLVDRNQPLTSRVTVNRFWQMIFGTGLVKSTDDFGTQGDTPTHPELLDWLAVEFMDSGWDVRHMIRLMVTSATYRQSSVITPERFAEDPENRLLSRGPRYRLQAEFIRDQALAASGLLDQRIGGASVSPYQPAGLWEELMSRSDGGRFSAQTYSQSHGQDLYRRTMYTFWKRTSPPPSLGTFDAPDRETCTVRRARTNTPLQALVLMNDPTYVESSRKLAERVMNEGGPSVETRLDLAYRLVIARRPRAEEVAVLKEVYERQLARYRQDEPAAKKLLAVGESPRDEKLSLADLAAWTSVTSVIFNLDEAVTRG